MASPIIRTKRLVLKALSLEDAGQLFGYRSKPEIFQWQSWKPKSVEEAKQFILNATQGFNVRGTWFQLGIFENETMLLIGDIGLHFLENDHQMEIGFTVSTQYQRKGYGQEATKGVISFLFNDLKKHRIIASVDPKNMASMSLLERIGFRKEGYFKKSILIDNQWEDEVIYAMLEEELT